MATTRSLAAFAPPLQSPPVLRPPPFPPPFPPAAPLLAQLNCTGVLGCQKILSLADLTNAIIVVLIIGLAFVIGFAILRKWVPMYVLRQVIPLVRLKPPYLPYGGFHTLWNWLKPVLTVSDEDLLYTAGLDALIFTRICAFGVQMFLPLSVLGMAMLFPAYASGHQVKINALKHDHVAVSDFTKYTTANLRPGSGLFWLTFAYVIVCVPYVFWLLMVHYRKFLILRQAYWEPGSSKSVTDLWKHPNAHHIIAGTGADELDASNHIYKTSWATLLNTCLPWAMQALPDEDADPEEGVGAESLLAAAAAPGKEVSDDDISEHGADPAVTIAKTEARGIASPIRKTSSKVLAGLALPARGLLALRGQVAKVVAPEQPTMSREITQAELADVGPGNEAVRFKWWELPAELEAASAYQKFMAGVGLPEDERLQEAADPGHAGDEHAEATAQGTNGSSSDGKGLTKDDSMSSLPKITDGAVGGGTGEDGGDIMVNAQQYVVLVQDVPDPAELNRGSKWWRSVAYASATHVPRTVGAELASGARETFMFAGRFAKKEGPMHRASSATAVQPLDEKAAARREQELAAAEARYQLVVSTFTVMFPDSFVEALPVYDHEGVDRLLFRWNAAWRALDSAVAALNFSKDHARPKHKLGCCGCSGEEVDTIDFYKAEIKALEAAIVEKRAQALSGLPSRSFFIFFNSQRDASIAAQSQLHGEAADKFITSPAPAPDEVNWATLWVSARSREGRYWVSVAWYCFMMVFPIGFFTGAFASLTQAVCGNNSTGKVYWHWYCNDQSNGAKFARSLATGILPAILLTLWQVLLIPRYFYYFAQYERRYTSFSALDRRISYLFFYWATFNLFLQGMLGGAVLGQIGDLIKYPNNFFSIAGNAMPQSSAYFLHFILIQAFAIGGLRFIFPSPAVIAGWFRICGCCKLRTQYQTAFALSPPSNRFGREMGILITIVIVGLTYGPISPLLLPAAAAYFIIMWAFWRYQALYVIQRTWESGGAMWEPWFNQILGVLALMTFFTAGVMAVSKFYIGPTLMLILVFISMLRFYWYIDKRFKIPSRYMPLHRAAMTPRATVDASIYTAPPLRPGSRGWQPEYGKAWQKWTVPTYTA